MASLANTGGDLIWPVPADSKRQPQTGIRRPSPGGLAKRPGTSALSLRPVAGLEAVRQLATWPVLFQGDQKHSLPADPVQPETAARTTGAEGRQPRSQRHGIGAISTRKYHDFVPELILAALSLLWALRPLE